MVGFQEALNAATARTIAQIRQEFLEQQVRDAISELAAWDVILNTPPEQTITVRIAPVYGIGS